MPLCTTCQSIDVRDLLASFRQYEALETANGSNWGGIEQLVSVGKYQTHQKSLAAVRNAAALGCEFCEMVWAEHGTFLNKHENGNCRCDEMYPGAVLLVICQNFAEKTPCLLAILDDHEMYTRGGYQIAKFEICFLKGAQIPFEDTPLLLRFAHGGLPSDLSSEPCLSLGATWLRKCLQEHPQCLAVQHQHTILPTRVVDVGSISRQPFLHESDDNEHGKWVALSYCWGGNSNFTLNATSFSKLRKGLPVSDFPPTIRDAILVTRALGMQYLWVDALCIVQDDPNDWAFEASRMGNIYRHAVVTIAATSAESTYSGFLDKREPCFSCNIPWRSHQLPNEHPGGADVYPVRVRYHFPLPIPFSHWETRGWTFQEKLLSPRLLTYTTRDMVWECSDGRAIEREPDSRWAAHFSGPAGLKDLIQELSQQENTASKTSRFSSHGDVYDFWYKLVEKYSLRQLSYSDDCLVAIAGFTKFFQEVLHDEYCAGLWRQDILFGLCWKSNDLVDDSTPSAIRPQYLGPSWSWLSVFSAGADWPFRYKELLYLATVTDIKASNIAHGSPNWMRGGELTLVAPYRNLNLRVGEDVVAPWNLDKLAQVILTKHDLLMGTHTSRSVIIPSGEALRTFTFVQIMMRKSDIYLLLLELIDGLRVVGQKLYRRVAVVELVPYLYQSDGYEDAELCSDLLAAAHLEVTAEDWPKGEFVIV